MAVAVVMLVLTSSAMDYCILVEHSWSQPQVVFKLVAIASRDKQLGDFTDLAEEGLICQIGVAAMSSGAGPA